jgi:hypothetical protein
MDKRIKIFIGVVLVLYVACSPIISPDVVIMAGVFGLAAALLPSIFTQQKPARETCVLSTAILIAIATAFGMVGLWLSCTAEIVSAILWFVLLIQPRRPQIHEMDTL